MTRGSDLARSFAPEHADAIEAMLQQLLIVLIGRAGGRVKVPVAEIDGTGDRVLSFKVDPIAKAFEFVVSNKQ